MDIFTDAIVASLAVLGIYLLLWMISAALSGPIRPGSSEMLTALLCVHGRAPAMQYTVERLLWLRGRGIAEFDIVIVDAGLDEDALEVARRLAEDTGVTLYMIPEETKKAWMKT